MGHTYDLSATGLSVNLPAVDCDIQGMFDDGGLIEIVLSITPRLVRVKVKPVHCETIVPGIPHKSACIGMKIDREDKDYPNYIEYLRELQ
jgi:hypothetical protein